MKTIWLILLSFYLCAFCCDDENLHYSYVQVDDPSFENAKINDIVEINVSGEYILVAVGRFGSWTSRDGLLWAHYDGPNITKIVDRASEIFAVDTTGSLYKSIDGQSWSKIELGDVTVENIIRIDAGKLLLVGEALDVEEWKPVAWISEDGNDWDRLCIDSGNELYAYTCAHNPNFIVVGGGFWDDETADFYPRIWYTYKNSLIWYQATVTGNTSPGYVEQIIAGDNVYYANTTSMYHGFQSYLWRSDNGIYWRKVDDSEVANSGDYFRFYDIIATGLDNVTHVVGVRNGQAAVWFYTRSSGTWNMGNASSICGSSVPGSFTGIGYSSSIAPGYIYIGYGRKTSGVMASAIYLLQPDEE